MKLEYIKIHYHVTSLGAAQKISLVYDGGTEVVVNVHDLEPYFERNVPILVSWEKHANGVRVVPPYIADEQGDGE